MTRPSRKPAWREPAGDPGPRRYVELAARMPEQGLDLREVFPATTEIEMEIGFGRGMFLVGRAQQVPDHGLLGIEIKTKWAYLVGRRCERDGLRNVRVLGGDIRTIVEGLGPDGCLARCFTHFPDPWWKKKHQKRMVIAQPLLDGLARLLRPGGELFVQTDVAQRAEDYQALLGGHPDFVTAPTRVETGANVYGALSNREKRAIEDGLPIHRVVATRRPVGAA